jgi:hypothetical protein
VLDFTIGEHHYSQSIINHYQYCRKAADYYMINAHEAVRPTEFVERTQMIGNQQEELNFKLLVVQNQTMLLFCHLIIGGPMDYTPGFLKWILKNSVLTIALMSTARWQINWRYT